MLSVRCSAAGSAIRPPATFFLPICMRPLRKVPAVMTTLLAINSAPQMVRMPTMCLACCDGAVTFREGSTISSSAWSCQMSRLGVLSSTLRHSQINLPRSHCALGDHTAGPFDRFSIRNWIAVLSVTSPMLPPSASISLTICPLAIPPTAGLHDIWAILFMSIVTRHVRAPMFAAAVAASHPACPPPITITSYFRIIVLLNAF